MLRKGTGRSYTFLNEIQLYLSALRPGKATALGSGILGMKVQYLTKTLVIPMSVEYFSLPS